MKGERHGGRLVVDFDDATRFAGLEETHSDSLILYQTRFLCARPQATIIIIVIIMMRTPSLFFHNCSEVDVENHQRKTKQKTKNKNKNTKPLRVCQKFFLKYSHNFHPYADQQKEVLTLNNSVLLDKALRKSTVVVRLHLSTGPSTPALSPICP